MNKQRIIMLAGLLIVTMVGSKELRARGCNGWTDQLCSQLHPSHPHATTGSKSWCCDNTIVSGLQETCDWGGNCKWVDYGSTCPDGHGVDDCSGDNECHGKVVDGGGCG